MEQQSASPTTPCRVCGAPGRPYMSGRWCTEHSPHAPQPVPPPHGLTPRGKAVQRNR